VHIWDFSWSHEFLLIAFTEEQLLDTRSDQLRWKGRKERSNPLEVRKQCWKVLKTRLPWKAIDK